MTNTNQKVNSSALRIIFFIQIGLLCLMAIIFILGYQIPELNIGAFFFAVILGALGASITLMKRIRNKNLSFEGEYLKLKNFATLMPILYGTLMAGVAYLFFMSGILSGDGGNGILTTNLFPNFKDSDVYNINVLEQFVKATPINLKDTGKLLVWCFLAGYSEKFVVGILDQLESKSS